MTSIATNPAAFRIRGLNKRAENSRQTFQAPGDAKIADAILVLALMYMAVLLCM